MVYVLLFIGLNQTPAQLGSYDSLQACETAIRAIYETRLTPRGINLSKDLEQSINFAVENKLKYQKDYVCQKRV